MKHGRPLPDEMPDEAWEAEDGWRCEHAHRVWQAAAAIIGFAVAWDLGTKYYLVGGKEWVEP